MARVWLYEHGYVLPSDKRVTLLVRAARGHAEQVLSKQIAVQFNPERVSQRFSSGCATRRTAPAGAILLITSSVLKRCADLVGIMVIGPASGKRSFITMGSR